MILASNHRHTSRNILVVMLVLFALAAGVLFWHRGVLDVYLHNQVTAAGWIINGGIVLLFLFGLVRLIFLFLRYAREEAALNRFVASLNRSLDPDDDVPGDTIIAQRYHTLLDLHGRGAAINHSALASTLMASESSLLSFPKFVNNVLILTGVFGTIVSLSIALLGASELITPAHNAALGTDEIELKGLDTVIHGMSTALSTTMTAIVAYLFFGYFYLRLSDTQTWVLSRVEHITTTMLMPRYQVQEDTALNDFADLIRAASALTQRFDDSQETFNTTAAKLAHVIDEYRREVRHASESMDEIRDILRRGFRLPSHDDYSN